MLSDESIIAHVHTATEAKVQNEQWTDIYDEQRGIVLGLMTEAQMKTLTTTTDYGETVVTVVAPESSTHIDYDKLRKKLLAAGMSSAQIKRILVSVTTYSLDEDALANAIEDGWLTPKQIPTIVGTARNPYVKITIRNSK